MTYRWSGGCGPSFVVGPLRPHDVLDRAERNLFAVAIGAGGLIGVGVAVDRTLNDVIDVNVEDNEICVNVAAVAAAASCNQ
jgi:hypothetical protein